MLPTKKTRYGLRAMIEIAVGSDEPGGILQKDIASRQKISTKFLDHIIHSLKTHGLIQNYKGKKSGYTLCRPAAGITVYDVVKSLEPGIISVDCLNNPTICSLKDSCAAKIFWKGLDEKLTNELKSVTLEELAGTQKKLAGRGEPAYFI